MKFVDLFAGLGGFHLALSKLGHNCVFASEIDKRLSNLYKKNFGMEPAGDIREVATNAIPQHEILCAGFPCQPFSKAGYQEGLNHPELGGLYQDILRIVKAHRPLYLIMENVPNLARHNNGETWDTIEGLLRNEGYYLEQKKLSPHHFGIPQIRERIYIVGSRTPLDGFNWPEPIKNAEISIKTILDVNPPDARKIPEQVNRCLSIWQEFLDNVPASEKIPHPMWSMEFGATYPFEDTTPSVLSVEQLGQYLGSYGTSLNTCTTKEDIFQLLPSYARVDQEMFPKWKIKYIQQCREFYDKHKSWLDDWMEKIKVYPQSFQKLEWNCQDEVSRVINQYVIQIRPSGVRVKRPTTAPSLVAMTATQVPIIGWENRYITPQECKRLQSMNDLIWLPEGVTKAYEALGNAINVNVAMRVAEKLVGRAQECVSFEKKVV